MNSQAPWVSLKFPAQCESDIHAYKRVINDYRKACAVRDQDVLFDCGDVSFLRPLGVNILALLIRGLLCAGSRKIYFTHPGENVCKSYLNSQGFYNEFPVQNNIVEVVPLMTSVGLRRIQSFEPLYIEEIARWLNHNSLLPQNAIGDAVKITLSELLNNVIDHSQSSIGCYVSTQAYHKERTLVLSVADLGIGFLETLRPRYKSLKSNKDAIALAVKSGISARSRGGNAGASLNILSDFLEHHAGSLEIISMDGLWRQYPNGTMASTIPFSFPGSCITMSFDSRRISGIDHE